MDFILIHDPAGEFVDFDLVNTFITVKAKELVDPNDHSIGAAFVGDSYSRRAAEQPRGVEDIINSLVLAKPTGMYTSPSGIESPANEGIVIGNGQADGTHVVS